MGILCLAAGFYGSEAVSDYCFGLNTDFWNRFKLFDYVKEIDNTYLELDKQLLCTDICPCKPVKSQSNFYQSNFESKFFDATHGFDSLTPCLSSRDYS